MRKKGPLHYEPWLLQRLVVLPTYLRFTSTNSQRNESSTTYLQQHKSTLEHDSKPSYLQSQKSQTIMTDQVRTAHLLIKHTSSRNPVSRRTGETVTLSPQEALAELQQYEARIKEEGIDVAFPKYAAERSDCSSCKNNG
jgi:delta 1-pyrroline-5-carboxylate dehydrogenase